MKFTTTIFSLTLAAGVFATPHHIPTFNTTSTSEPSGFNNTRADGGNGDAAALGSGTVSCNRFAPFPSGLPHFAPGCSPVSIPHGGASTSGISNSYAAPAVGVAVIVALL
ncbi:hypothetical protein F4859DRAFT_519479 [Xylaria cf. heliscus]|nr:hypothetical protein F4859DRAFT_519479 [Xylaria cf. heliscus]